jgi:hypothetical protein
MDEKKLAELLKDAVADTPPPTFTQTDITRESERQRARRRNGLLAGSAFGVAVLAGATALGVALWTGQGSYSDTAAAGSSASTGNELAAPDELPNEDGKAAAPTESQRAEDFPPGSPKQGGTPDGNGGPAGPTGTPSGCEQVDRELAAALAGELPAAANVKAGDAVPVSLSCGSATTGAAFDLPDGRLNVLLVPASDMAFTATSSGSAQALAPTSDGRQVLVVSEPASQGDTVPYEADLSRFARDVAKIY